MYLYIAIFVVWLRERLGYNFKLKEDMFNSLLFEENSKIMGGYFLAE